MAQKLLDNSSCTNIYSLKTVQTAANLTITNDAMKKSTSSILRKLRYKTGKLNSTNIIPCSKQKQGFSNDMQHKTRNLYFIHSDDSNSCDDPEREQDTNQSEISNNKQPPPVNKKIKGFPCSVCGKIASSSVRLKEHLSRHSGIKPLECNICSKKFAWRYSLKVHMMTHMENNPNKCSICGKKYCNKSSIKNHMMRVHGDPKKNFKCEKCDKKFVTKSELDRHVLNHSKKRDFVCEFCGNSYKFKAALLVHYKIHSGEKPYKCDYCEKEFLHLSSIIGHRRRHTGEKPYLCKVCGKSFYVKRALTSHMSVHSTEGKFNCKDCGKTFKSRSGYNVHLDLHLGIKRHSCKYCGKTFRAWCNMYKHAKRHLKEKIHKCEICAKIFINKQELDIHIKCHNDDHQKSKRNNVNNIITSCSEIIPAPTLTNSSCNIESSVFSHTHQNDIIPHMDISDNQVIYDCNMPNTIDKCPPDKCQLLQDNYVSQYLYPTNPPIQYVSQNVPIQTIYSTDPEQNSQRSACLSNINSSYNCIQLNNHSFNTYPYNEPNTDELLTKCKLCRSLFHSTLVLRSHLLDYHRIDEENIDGFLT